MLICRTKGLFPVINLPSRMARRLLPLIALLATGTTAVCAKPPTLTPIAGDELPSAPRAGEKVALRLLFRDGDGDRPVKAVFVDQGPSSTSAAGIPASAIEPGNAADGINITWAINGFEAGTHRASFIVTGSDGNTVRYPQGSDDYVFTAESLAAKWIAMAVGVFVGLFFVPFLVYMLARSVNRKGDPSGAARIGLLFGILACCALFAYLFLSTFGPLVFGIGVVGAIAAVVLLASGRR